MSYKIWVLLAVVIAAFVLRVYRIDQVPASLYYDEVDLGYQARSLLETHKDYRGRLTPFYVLSFNDPRVPIPSYLTALTTMLFQKEEYQVRMPTVILGTLSVLLAFWLAKQWTDNFWAGLLAAWVFATNPWQIQNSRWALEQIYCGFFLLLALNLFFYGLKKRSFAKVCWGVVVLGLSVYTYRTMSLLSPLILVVLVVLYWRELIKFGFKKLLIAGLLYLLLVVPFLRATTIAAPDVPRFQQVSISADPTILIDVKRNRELDSGDIEHGLGNKAVWYSVIFHNKFNEVAGRFVGNYLQAFSSEFLFVNGTPNPRESVGKMGELLLVDILPLLVGFCFIYSHLKQKQFRFLLLLLLLAPIPSALTSDGGRHGSRLFIFSVPLLLVVAVGVWQWILRLSSFRLKWLYFGGMAMLWMGAFGFYLHQYYVHFALESASDYGYGFKQAMLDVKKEAPSYSHVYMTSDNDPPIIYFLFWNKIPPAQLQDYGSDFLLGNNFNKPLDKYKTITFYVEAPQVNDLVDYLKDDTLYVLTGKNLRRPLESAAAFPVGIRVIDIIKYPNGQIAFYVVAKEKVAKI